MTSSTTIAKKNPQTIEEFFEENAERFPPLLGNTIAPDKFLQLCTGAFRTAPKLRECTLVSLVDCMVGCAVLGLEPNTAKQESFLIPYAGKATLVIGYQGWITLASRAGMEVVCVDVIRKGDTYHISRGTDPGIQHDIDLEAKRGDVLAAYCVIALPSGRLFNRVVMKKELDAVRDKALSQSRQNDTPWRQYEEAMQLKTAIIRGVKHVPKFGDHRLAVALASEDAIEVGRPFSYGDGLDLATPAAGGRRPRIAAPRSEGAFPIGDGDEVAPQGDPDALL